MSIYAYEGISKEEIEAVRITSEGKKYTLNHPDKLIVNMRYIGEGKANANSQGWERSSIAYFREVKEKNPEIFSKRNNLRIENGESPRVDAKFVKSFPQFKGYENETLIHHHIGKDGQAVALPQSVHKGSGEIHIYENKLGITDNGRKFSDSSKRICEKNPRMVGKTSDYFKTNNKVDSVSKNREKKQNAIRRASAQDKVVFNTNNTKANSIKKATASMGQNDNIKTSNVKSRSM